MGTPALDREQFELEQFVKAQIGLKKNAILSGEWLCCGRGIPLIYEFFRKKEHNDDETRELDLGEKIFGRIESDALARKTFNKFLEMLGFLLQSNCTTLLPDSGIILMGTIISSVVQYMTSDFSQEAESYFFRGFYSNKDNYSYLKEIPVFFTSETDLNLKGCLVSYPSQSTTLKR